MATFFSLPEDELERLCESVSSQISLERSAFTDRLVEHTLRRYPPLIDTSDRDEPEQEESPTFSLLELEGGMEATVAFVAAQLLTATRSPYFPLVRQVADNDDSQAFEQLMGMLDRNIRLKSIVFRHGLDAEAEFAALWGRIWQAIPKWDGRNFRAYVARIVRNHCLDEIARRKKNPGLIEDDPQDPGGRVHSGSSLVSSRDALNLLTLTLDELEGSGRITALDGVVFDLIGQGRAVADILEVFRDSPLIDRASAFLRALDTTACEPEHIVLLGFLLDGLTAEEIGLIRGPEGGQQAAKVAEILEGLTDPDALSVTAAMSEQVSRHGTGIGTVEDRDLIKLLLREGMTTKQLERSRELTANALNLRINRTRLKLWMALVDKAYEALRRRAESASAGRGALDAVDLAIVQHRCTVPTHAGCRMYKDSGCKREASAEDIARRGGVDLSPAALQRRMAELRRRVVEEGLGMVFPDYNSCMNERRPPRKSKSPR
jgi:Sigma-70 region 2